MPVEVTIPQAGESITEVQVGEWRKSVGDRVEVDEVIVEIETDKAAMELPAPVAGRLIEIRLATGADAAIGDIVAIIEEGADGNVSAPAAEAPAAAKPKAQEPRVMPAAARVMAQNDLTTPEVEGTGPGGRILKENVEQMLEERAATAATPALAPQQSREAPPAAAATSSGDREDRVVPMTPMRKVIARNLVQAQQNAALLTTFNEADMSAVIEIRKKHKERFLAAHGIKLGFMSFFVKASVEALKAVPAVNAMIRDTNIVYRNYCDIGIAVGGGRGLLVPNIRDAQSLSFSEIEKTIADFGARAKQNRIELSELQGGTFTISNGGIYGSMLSTPIINSPQSAILGMHSIDQRAVVRDGQIVARPMMYLALTYDHRLVDGREAVTFLNHIKDVIEDPTRILFEI
jgi:2-oxoglutarate dehydrogenase E2 component (dihydrolipoamide succinyltransferase)